MIVNLKGSLEAVGPDWVHLQLGGVTFQVSVPASAIKDLGPVGGQVRLFTHMRIRDEQPMLYGFTTAASMELFQLLTAVSGVGPRLALALLSALSPGGLRQAIATADVAALSSAPGVGQRTASRIILELKGKVDFADEAQVTFTGGIEADVIAALTALGYSTAEARRGVAGLSLSEDQQLEDLIRQALQSLSSTGS